MYFSKEEIISFLTDLGLNINEENIKWAYEVLLKELKVEVKIRSFENNYEENFFDEDDECCGCCEDGECDCID